MPRRDGTGPMGIGPMTGRGTGFCAGFRTSGFLNSFSGGGSGFSRGQGYRRSLCFSGLVPSITNLAYRWFNRNRMR